MDLTRQHSPIASELRASYERVLAGSSFILRDEVEHFEAEFADYCGTEHCIGVSSGTAAVMIMLRATGVKAGDEVIVPSHTFIATALAVLHAGARPVCVDVDPGTGLIDPEAVAAAIGPSTSAIVAVHLYGQACEMDALDALATRHGLALLEDAAQAHGATYRGRRAGGFGAAAAFSFYPSKNLGALGDAGAICTNDAGLADAARSLRDLGRTAAGTHEVSGYNERLDALQAAFLRVKLRYLDGWNSARHELAALYRARLAGLVELGLVDLLEELPDSCCVYHLLPIRLDGRDHLAAALAQQGIMTGVHYPAAVPDHPALRPVLESLGAKSDGFPAASSWVARELSLPIFPGLTNDELTAVTNAVAMHISRRTDNGTRVPGGCGRDSRAQAPLEAGI